MKTFIYRYLKYIVLALAAAAIIYGVFSGEIKTVFTKATLFCLECIGIG